MSRYDVIVSGAGPGGAATALLAARAGAHTLVLERARFPRYKVCGEFLSAEGVAVLRRLDVLDRLLTAGAERIRVVRLSSDGTAIPLPGAVDGDGAALGVSRALLDSTLLDLARAAGADVRERCTVTAPVLEDGRVRGVRYREARASSEVEVRAPVVVAADGRRSALARALHQGAGDPARSQARSWLGVEAHFRGAPDRLRGAVELHWFDGGYLGLSLVEGGRINLGALVRVGALRACGGRHDRLLHDRMLRVPAVADVLQGLDRCTDWKSVGPLRFGPRRASARGALFVGDAAGTVDPFTGEGMSHALMAAELATPVALRAAASGGVDPAAGEGYERAWRRAFLPASRRSRWLGALLGRPRLVRAGLAILRAFPSSVLPAVVRYTRTGTGASPTG